jgi:hypothetical protein
MSEGHIYLGSCTKRSLSDCEGGSSRPAERGRAEGQTTVPVAARVDRATIHKESNIEP